jgi:hypothetical protein
VARLMETFIVIWLVGCIAVVWILFELYWWR